MRVRFGQKRIFSIINQIPSGGSSPKLVTASRCGSVAQIGSRPLSPVIRMTYGAPLEPETVISTGYSQDRQSGARC
jgi:hypothetical protein